MCGGVFFIRESMSESEELPSEKQPRIFRFVRGTINNILSETPAWPENPLKLRLESIGIYQDFSGPAIKELEENNEIERIQLGEHRYITNPESATKEPDEEIHDATERFYEVLENQNRAFFAECVTYVVLCHIYQDVKSRLDIDVLPKGNYPRKMRGFTSELDGLVEMQHELFPIEVYNGQKYMMDSHSKMNDANTLSFDEEPISNPLIISRISSEEARKRVFGLNGLIIDAGKIFVCEEKHPNIESALETLKISDHVELLPKFETSKGTELDGRTYHDLARDTHGGYSEIVPDKMSDAGEEMSDEVIKRFKGGIYLLYVNTFYRRASERIEREACLVLQEFYNRLLRKSGSTDYDELIDISWDNFLEKHTRLKNPANRKDAILQQTRDYISRLVSEGIVQRHESGVYTPGADHPNKTLSFSDPNVKVKEI